MIDYQGGSEVLEAVRSFPAELARQIVLVAATDRTAVLLGLAHHIVLGHGDPVFTSEVPFPILPGVFFSVGLTLAPFQF